jgi:AAA domain/Bifunctional DNA primase/polymerase, N-terminal
MAADRPIYFPELLAVTYAKSGLVPIPLDRLSGEPLLDRRTLHGPPEVATIAAWWDAWPDANVGLLTGPESGLAVVVLKGEPPTVKDFAQRCGGDLPDTPIVGAGERVHLYFRHPGMPIPNRADVLPGVDVKGSEGWWPAPGSVSPDDSYLVFVRSPNQVSLSREDGECIAPMPDWLLSQLNSPATLDCAPESDSLPSPKGKSWKGTNFNPRSAADLLGAPAPPVEWVWKPYLPEGALVLLAGFMKAGKTTFAYPLIRSVAQGKPFLGSPTQQGGVLVLAVEEHPRDVQRRLERFGVSANDPVEVHTGPLDESPATFTALKEYVQDRRIRLVVLDTLPAFWGIEDENDNAKIGKAVRPWLALARETGAAVLLVHHESKAGGEGGRGIRGASSLFGLVDQGLLLTVPPGASSTNKRILSAFGRYSETPPKVVIELDDTDYTLVGTSPEAAKAADAERILVKLPTDESWSIERIRKETDLTDKRIREALASLGEKVIRDGLGVKGNPHLYRRVPDSIPSDSCPIGKESEGDRP